MLFEEEVADLMGEAKKLPDLAWVKNLCENMNLHAIFFFFLYDHNYNFNLVSQTLLMMS